MSLEQVKAPNGTGMDIKANEETNHQMSLGNGNFFERRFSYALTTKKAKTNLLKSARSEGGSHHPKRKMLQVRSKGFWDSVYLVHKHAFFNV